MRIDFVCMLSGQITSPKGDLSTTLRHGLIPWDSWHKYVFTWQSALSFENETVMVARHNNCSLPHSQCDICHENTTMQKPFHWTNNMTKQIQSNQNKKQQTNLVDIIQCNIIHSWSEQSIVLYRIDCIVLYWSYHIILIVSYWSIINLR